MKPFLIFVALSIATAVSAPAFAQQPDPKTQAECEKAGRKWDPGGNICLPKA